MSQPPKPLSDDTRQTSAAASGSAVASGAGGPREITVSRVLPVQLAPLEDAAWTALRALARESATFCNKCLADHYARVLGYQPPDGTSVFRRAKGTLSGDVRVALAREAWTTWRRHGVTILSGAQRLALFDADRAIVCRAEHLNKGRRQIHAMVRTASDGRLVLTTRLVGASIGPRHQHALVSPPANDRYVHDTLQGLAAGWLRLLKVSFRFERPGRKVFALLTYQMTIAVPPAGHGEATLGPLEPDGTLWLRWVDEAGRQRGQDHTAKIAELAHKKLHFAGIARRLRARRRRSGSGHRRAYRDALIRAGSFGAWARGPLHQLSANIVATLRRHDIGHLAIGPLEFQDLPMAALIQHLGYKCAEAGIVLTRFDPVDRSTDRALTQMLTKQQRSISRKRRALAVLVDAV